MKQTWLAFCNVLFMLIYRKFGLWRGISFNSGCLFERHSNNSMSKRNLPIF